MFDLRSVDHRLPNQLEGRQPPGNNYESKRRSQQGFQGQSEDHDAGPSMKLVQGHRRMSHIPFSWTILGAHRNLASGAYAEQEQTGYYGRGHEL